MKHFVLMFALTAGIAFPAFSQDVMNQSMLKAVNAIRATGCRCGDRQMPPVQPLTFNAKLANAAKRQAMDLFTKKRFSHEGSDGSDVSDRVSDASYNWNAVGENIANGYTSVPEVVKGWIQSTGHCENMMDKDYHEMGAANKNEYWVQVFGRSF